MRTVSILAFAAIVVLIGCSKAPEASRSPVERTPFRAVADTKQVMNWILEPNADVVWEAVGTIVTAEGEQNLAPSTEEQWQAVRNAAATVAEFGNLLMLEGRARDRGEWMRKARALIDASNEAVQAAEAKDTAMLFTAGGDMYLACTACHTQYVIGGMQRVAGDQIPNE